MSCSQPTQTCLNCRTAGTPSTSSSPGYCSASSPKTLGSSRRTSSPAPSAPTRRQTARTLTASFTDLFAALDTQDPSARLTYLASFPYVNGRLFAAKEAETVPTFTKRARQLLIDLGTLIWQEINPDIFGPMFQAIVTPGTRSDLGQHYTSVPNILKTIEPLYLDELKEQLNKGFNSVKSLEALLDRISGIKVFDPACGSGNFLIIAYKELRKLEHAILERSG